jgi:hypothetical protein
MLYQTAKLENHDLRKYFLGGSLLEAPSTTEA